MSEEQNALPVALYDFLYKDSARLASYYAQLFSGRLSALEEVDSEKETKDQTAGLNVAITSGSVKTSNEFQTTTKRIIDPHDLITTDVLSHLVTNNRINENIKTAPHHALVLTQGVLTFVDKYMIEMAVAAWEVSANLLKHSISPEQEALANTARLMKGLFTKFAIPSAFFLRCQDGVQAAGTIKEQALEEPISTYYFKHGIGGLADVYLVGIKETPSSANILPDAQLLGVVQQMAQGLSELIFDPGAIRITPIAIFRKI